MLRNGYLISDQRERLQNKTNFWRKRASRLLRTGNQKQVRVILLARRVIWMRW